ncbi:hypothetical protein [uncultured Ruminococcus sp.]|uniref:hypothetical protein n=1 Tax=uncultured Ruminococcus sp. TaxID=165186 RepID=UPI0026659C1C|nr:hypothetical protein [uncultured Ruminococcus sp.]
MLSRLCGKAFSRLICCHAATKQTVIFIAQDRNSQGKHSRYLTYDSDISTLSNTVMAVVQESNLLS